jgi:hypothetical protein
MLLWGSGLGGLGLDMRILGGKREKINSSGKAMAMEAGRRPRAKSHKCVRTVFSQG